MMDIQETDDVVVSIGSDELGRKTLLIAITTIMHRQRVTVEAAKWTIEPRVQGDR